MIIGCIDSIEDYTSVIVQKAQITSILLKLYSVSIQDLLKIFPGRSQISMHPKLSRTKLHFEKFIQAIK